MPSRHGDLFWEWISGEAGISHVTLGLRFPNNGRCGRDTDIAIITMYRDIDAVDIVDKYLTKINYRFFGNAQFANSCVFVVSTNFGRD